MVTEETHFSDIAEVKSLRLEAGEKSDKAINNYLEEGWIVLDVKAMERLPEEAVIGWVLWVLGKRRRPAPISRL